MGLFNKAVLLAAGYLVYKVAIDDDYEEFKKTIKECYESLKPFFSALQKTYEFKMFGNHTSLVNNNDENELKEQFDILKMAIDQIDHEKVANVAISTIKKIDAAFSSKKKTRKS